MPSCSILIPNYNSFEAIQLCIESIRHFTNYPHEIIVYDDRCINEVDDIYLAECAEKGWITLYSGEEQQTHGGSLNILVNEKCQTDYAMIIDCDIQIIGYNWLKELMAEAKANPNMLAIVDFKPSGFAHWGYRTGFYTFWFGLINMKAYRDGMQVDWMLSKRDRREEPYKSEFAKLYPPYNDAYFSHLFKVNGWDFKDFNKDLVFDDPGAALYVKAKYDNPKGYKVLGVPPSVKAKFRHFGHISMISIPDERHSEKVRRNREARFAIIKSELNKLRGAK